MVLAACSTGGGEKYFTTVGVAAPASVCSVDPQSFGDAEPVPDLDEGNGCGYTNAYKVTSVNDISFTTAATITCDVADTVSTWFKTSVQPHAMAIYGEPVVKASVAASYICRPRNNVAGGKLSEHGLGNAIDFGGFTLKSGREIVVEGGWFGNSQDQSFLRAIRAEACGPFHTVLGPGSDSYHKNHLHLDLQKERRGGGPFCH